MKHENEAERLRRPPCGGHESNRLVGWTYESDQQAIQEAKQNLEDLQTDKQSEDLQYRIDQLEKEKAFLESIPDSKELNEQKETYEQWMDRITENGQVQKDILDELSTLYTNIGVIGQTVGKWAAADYSMMSTDEGRAYNAVMNEEGKGSLSSMESTLSNLSSMRENGQEGTLEYNQSVAEGRETLDKLKENLTKTDIGNYVGMSYDEFLNTAPEDAELRNFITDENSWNALQSNYQKYVLGYDNILSDELAYKNIVETKNYPNSSQKAKFSVDVSNGESYASSYLMTNAEKGMQDTKGENDYIYYSKKGDVSWTKMDVSEEDVRNGKGEDYLKNELDTGDMVGFTGKNKEINYLYKGQGDNWYYADATAAAKGSLGLPGGATLINEEGTEGIITPQGTLTALPSKTGVVPADITKNLWALGEIAPNLVKGLDSLGNKYPEKSWGSSDDHSTNINNLYATFQADENFDFDEFLVDVRGVIGTTRHNA